MRAGSQERPRRPLRVTGKFVVSRFSARILLDNRHADGCRHLHHGVDTVNVVSSTENSVHPWETGICESEQRTANPTDHINMSTPATGSVLARQSPHAEDRRLRRRRPLYNDVAA